jgi:HlyD family secretion protein
VVTYNVLISVDPTDVQMLPDMTATVAIITASADNVVVVPASAVANNTVRVLRNGSPVLVPVVTGISDGINTQIVSGLQPGDQVITGTSSGTSAGSRSSSNGTSIFGFGGPGGGNTNNRGTGSGSNSTNQRAG